MTKFVAPSIQSSAYKPSPVSKCLGEWQGDVRKIWLGGGKEAHTVRDLLESGTLEGITLCLVMLLLEWPFQLF